MKESIVLVGVAFLCLVAFPTATTGKNLRFWPKPTEGWPNPSVVSRNKMFMSTSHKFNYGESKVWKCTYSNGSAPAISISPSVPSTPSIPLTPKTSPPPPQPTPPPPTPSSPPPTPKTSPPPLKSSPPPPKSSTPSLPPPTPKTSPPPPILSPPPQTPKTSPPPPPTSSPQPPTPKKSPTHLLPSDDVPPSPRQPSTSHAEHHHRENRWGHIDHCMRNMGHVTMCRMQMEMSFYTMMFQVSDQCCGLIVNMKNECDDVAWGFFTDPFFVPLVRCTCHVTY